MDGELRRREFCKKFVALRLGYEQIDTPGQRNQAGGRGLSSGLSGPAMSLRFTRLIETKQSQLKWHPLPNDGVVVVSRLVAHADLMAQADLEPRKYLADCNMFGVEDASSGKIRVASALGNAGQVFGLLMHCGEPEWRWAFSAEPWPPH